MDIDAVLDGGAYATLSAVVLSRGLIHASGPYRCDHVRIRGRAVMTNTPPNGAFRGFGAPQTQFAVEVHMDRIAEALGLDPVRVRELNALRPGDTTATGQRLGKDCSALAGAARGGEAHRLHARRRARRCAARNRGIGLSLFFHGSGFTGGGEVKLASKASLALTERGARILVGSTEIGQGTRTMHAQIVADTLGVPYDAHRRQRRRHGVVPDSGPTVASRTCMVVGRILQRCAEEMRERLGGADAARVPAAARSAGRDEGVRAAAGDRRGTTPAIRATPTAATAGRCDVVEVEVDRDTWQVTPIAFTTVHEIGKAIHPCWRAARSRAAPRRGSATRCSRRS